MVATYHVCVAHVNASLHNNTPCQCTHTHAGLEGVDAFETLKAEAAIRKLVEEAAKADTAHPPKALELPLPRIPDPVIAKAALEVTAREGLPVKGTNAEAWEALRPKIVHDTRPVKVRRSV
jgi:hypothetical protein